MNTAFAASEGIVATSQMLGHANAPAPELSDFLCFLDRPGRQQIAA